MLRPCAAQVACRVSEQFWAKGCGGCTARSPMQMIIGLSAHFWTDGAPPLVGAFRIRPSHAAWDQSRCASLLRSSLGRGPPKGDVSVGALRRARQHREAHPANAGWAWNSACRALRSFKDPKPDDHRLPTWLRSTTATAAGLRHSSLTSQEH